MTADIKIPASAGGVGGGIKRANWLILGAILLYLAQVLPLLQTRWVEDESWQSIPAYSLITEGRIRNPTFMAADREFTTCVKPPAHTLLLAPVFKIFGVGVIQARLLSVLAGIGVIVLTFQLGRAFASAAVGVIASWLVAADNFIFLAGRSVRPEIFVALCGLLAMLLSLQASKNDSFIRAAFAGLAVGAAMLFHPNGLPLAFGAGALLFWHARIAIWKQRRVWGYIAGIFLLATSFWLWSHSTAIHRKAFVATYSRAEAVPLLIKFYTEAMRYQDFLGISNSRFSLPIPIPLRAHVVLLIMVSLIILAWKNRSLLGWLLLLISPYLLFWIYTINKTSRYFAVVTPLLAIVIAAALLALAKPRWFRVLIATGCVMCGLSQVAGNLLFLYLNRRANFAAVQKSLRQLIPTGESVYGAITFWPALYDRGYNAYDRLSFSEAIRTRQPHYLIINDRVMIKGQGLAAC